MTRPSTERSSISYNQESHCILFEATTTNQTLTSTSALHKLSLFLAEHKRAGLEWVRGRGGRGGPLPHLATSKSQDLAELALEQKRIEYGA